MSEARISRRTRRGARDISERQLQFPICRVHVQPPLDADADAREWTQAQKIEDLVQCLLYIVQKSTEIDADVQIALAVLLNTSEVRVWGY